MNTSSLPWVLLALGAVLFWGIDSSGGKAVRANPDEDDEDADGGKNIPDARAIIEQLLEEGEEPSLALYVKANMFPPKGSKAMRDLKAKEKFRDNYSRAIGKAMVHPGKTKRRKRRTKRVYAHKARGAK